MPVNVAEQSSPVPGVSRNVFVLSIVSLFNDISSEMLYPLIPLFLTSTLGAPVSLVGVIEGAAEMTASVLKGFSGWLSDRWGRRMPFVFTGYGLSAIAKPLLALAGGWPAVLFARVLDRFGKGVRSTARDAVIAESTKAGLRGRAYGFHRSLDQVGAVIGPLIAVPLLGLFHQNYRTMFIVAFIPGAMSMALLFLARETGRAVSGEAPAPTLRWRDTTPAFRRFLLVTLLFALGNSSDVFLILRAKQLGTPARTVFVIYALFNLATVLSSYPAGHFSDRIGRKRVLTASFFLFAIVYGGFALARHPGQLWVLFIFYGLYMGMSDGVSRAFAIDLVSPDHRGTALGLHSLATGITTFAASSIAGAMWSPLGSAAVFAYGAIMALVAMVLLQILVHPTNLQ